MEKIKVLLVDDEKEFVDTLKERLETRNLSPEVAYNGLEALKKVEEDIPDVIVLDLRMPEMDGIDVLRKIKEVYPKTEVIILTGHGTEKDKEEAKRLGAFDYLEKPVSLIDLMKKIEEAYRKKIEDTYVAATFAEAGEFSTAKKILKK